MSTGEGNFFAFLAHLQQDNPAGAAGRGISAKNSYYGKAATAARREGPASLIYLSLKIKGYYYSPHRPRHLCLRGRILWGRQKKCRPRCLPRLPRLPTPQLYRQSRPANTRRADRARAPSPASSIRSPGHGRLYHGKRGALDHRSRRSRIRGRSAGARIVCSRHPGRDRPLP